MGRPRGGDALESHGLLVAVGQAMRQSSATSGPITSVSAHLLYVQAVRAVTCVVADFVVLIGVEDIEVDTGWGG
ncbi:hypothetical protein [Actinomadura oligospora]|uniref:hypothetical protein n=1 Tax=Actinomadura oligospora TaxID=111804 RepID=UPI00047AEE0B|nr:hypothetical protein [Actinomadura oligospora]